MENLQSGVILNLLSDMGVQEKTVIDDNDADCKEPAALLQIVSIIPVLSESDDLWPKQGFFIKVSDSTHELFVSLPQEQDEMILNNELQIGQFIYVEQLESAYPVPLLKGLRLIPGRQPFDRDPKHLVGNNIMEAFSQTSSPLLIQRRTERARSISPCTVPLRDRRASTGRQNCRTRTNGLNIQGFDMGYSRKKQDLNGSGCSRRSWCETAKGSTVVKHEIIHVSHTPNSHDSPFRSAGFLSFHDDNSNTRLRTKDVGQFSKIVKNKRKSWNSSSARTSKEPLTDSRKRASSKNKIWAETEMLWDTLPSSLVKHGKEVLRQRDVSLLAAVDALQEAAAIERLLKCLSKFSELRLAKEDDQQPSINKFFKLQDYLTQCRGIVQSLTHTSSQRMADSDLNSPGYTKEALKLAVDRWRNATSWVKAAVASDLIPLSPEGKNEAKATKKPSQITMRRGSYSITKQRNNGEFHSGFAAEKKNIPEWEEGSTLNIARNLADSLQDECKTWFLGYIENYLDGFDNERLSKVPHGQVAESMCRIKRLNDFLDMMEASNSKSTPESPEFVAYGRVRNKIYEVLLKHVERTAMVLSFY
ncbi:hypothetical protein ERO13_D04G160200v2 [Gossypium hirsutum]|uniref:Uncharacterized protein n=1 Tax=Gossypium hirsutum TaxID=3635 RepID=A0A1U8ITS9_GOSHI|nr:uncharacterized protein LOC107898795 [Gossypium hirsutum]KAG4153053.1 hypothetical protein ERO13_D04G160200v2 [Gossypium hirsutum]